MKDRSAFVALLSFLISAKSVSLEDEQKLKRGYELAWFIHQDRDKADDIVAAAFADQETFIENQNRYLDYTAPQRRTKVQLTKDLQYQYLILKYSDDCQRRDLARQPAPELDTMLVYFFAFVAFRLFRTNSFRATAAVSRLLLRLSADHARELYRALYPLDCDRRERGDDEFNREKKVLYGELNERFGQLLIPEQTHVEKSFKQQARTPRLQELAACCLDQLAPWRDHCVLTVSGELAPRLPQSLASDQPASERDRMHVALHCLKIVAKMILGVDKDLLIPQFSCASGNDERPSRESRLLSPPMTGSDYDRLTSRVSLLRQRRQTQLAPVLRCKIDGDLRAEIDLCRSSESEPICFSDADGCLEVWADDVLLATYELPIRADGHRDTLTGSITLEAGQCLAFVVSLGDDAGGRHISTVHVHYRETSLVRSMCRWWQRCLYRLALLRNRFGRVASIGTHSMPVLTTWQTSIAVSIGALSVMVSLFALNGTRRLTHDDPAAGWSAASIHSPSSPLERAVVDGQLAAADFIVAAEDSPTRALFDLLAAESNDKH